jgi:hypothetical protein
MAVQTWAFESNGAPTPMHKNGLRCAGEAAQPPQVRFVNMAKKEQVTVDDHKISSFDCTKKVVEALANMHSLSLREIASHFAHKQKQEALRILRVLYSPEWEKPHEHLTTDARSRVAHIANRVLFGDKPPPTSAS